MSQTTRTKVAVAAHARRSPDKPEAYRLLHADLRAAQSVDEALADWCENFPGLCWAEFQATAGLALQ